MKTAEDLSDLAFNYVETESNEDLCDYMKRMNLDGVECDHFLVFYKHFILLKLDLKIADISNNYWNQVSPS